MMKRLLLEFSVLYFSIRIPLVHMIFFDLRPHNFRLEYHPPLSAELQLDCQKSTRVYYYGNILVQNHRIVFKITTLCYCLSEICNYINGYYTHYTPENICILDNDI